MKILKIILVVIALNFNSSVFAAVNGKWINTGGSVYNLNLYAQIIPVCYATIEGGAIQPPYIYLGNSWDTITFETDENCEDFYKSVVDFLDSSDSYWHWGQ